MWNSKSVTVVFPAYNEEPNIEAAVKDFLSVVDGSGQRIIDEVLVVDNNSKDRTGEIARAAGARVVMETKQGYGNALQCGLREAGNDIIILCEPDGTFTGGDAVKLLSYSDDFDMVCGTRTYAGLIRAGANMGFVLRWGNIAVAKMMQFLYFMPPLTDCGCTFRLIRREAARKIQPRLFVGRSHFLPNMVIAARIENLRIAEIPVNYGSRVGVSKITGTFKGTWNTGMAMIKLILSLWPTFVATRGRR